MLYAKVEKALVISGLNPYIGFLHRDGHQFKSLVYDFIERYRVHVDELIYTLCMNQLLTDGHIHTVEGGLLLNKKGKQIIINEFANRYHTSKESNDKRGRNLSQEILNDARMTSREMVSIFKNESDFS